MLEKVSIVQVITKFPFCRTTMLITVTEWIHCTPSHSILLSSTGPLVYLTHIVGHLLSIAASHGTWLTHRAGTPDVTYSLLGRHKLWSAGKQSSVIVCITLERRASMCDVHVTTYPCYKKRRCKFRWTFPTDVADILTPICKHTR
jgi:hypothetical protein